MTAPQRTRLPNRRRAETTEIAVGNTAPLATVGLDAVGQPRELFRDGAEDGSGLAAILHDAAVAISVALQHGVAARALAKEHRRLPESLDGPATKAASTIGAALDVLAAYEGNAVPLRLRTGARLRVDHRGRRLRE